MGRTAGKSAFDMAGMALAIGLLIGGCASTAAAQAGAAGTAPKTAEQVFKNIQALQGVPADQVNPIMQFMSGSLGVNCGFCHDPDAQRRELDTRETKKTAREMIRMVLSVNKNTFGGREMVSCYTCHLGNSKVPLPQVPGQPERAIAKEASAKAPLPTVDQLLDKYLAALGGAAAIQKISSRVAKGTLTEIVSDTPSNEPPKGVPVEMYFQRQDKRLTVAHLANGDSVAVSSGGLGWLLSSGGQLFGSAGRIYDNSAISSGRLRPMLSEELDVDRLQDGLYLAGRVKEFVSQLKVEGTEQVGDAGTSHESYVVSGRTESLPRVLLYFNKDSGLLARLVHYTETPLGLIPHQIDYSDYRAVDGVKSPFRWTVADYRVRRFLYQMDEVRQNVPIDESKFSKPSAPAASR